MSGRKKGEGEERGSRAGNDAGLDIDRIEVDGQILQVVVKPGPKDRPPILLFNGIGATWAMAVPFLHALKRTGAIIFDVPGIGGSPMPLMPYRPSTIAGLGHKLLGKLGHRQAYVAGVSWGGGMAQQFAHQHPDACRKLVLAATSTGALMVPGRPDELLKLAMPKGDFAKDIMRMFGSQRSGGAPRQDTKQPPRDGPGGGSELGYFYQLLAMAGWTSVPWLGSVRQPTLILAGRDDPIVPAVNAEILAQLLPNARLEMIDDGHLFLFTRPEETAALIEDFLDE